MKKKRIYLAIPFSGIEELSFKCANEVGSLLIANNLVVFSPISHSNPLWKTDVVQHTHDVWLEQDKHFVEWSDAVYIVVLEYPTTVVGEIWVRNSKGVQQEIEWAQEMGKELKIVYYNPKTRELWLSEFQGELVLEKIQLVK